MGPQASDRYGAGVPGATNRDSVKDGAHVVSPGDWHHGRALNIMEIRLPQR